MYICHTFVVGFAFLPCSKPPTAGSPWLPPCSLSPPTYASSRNRAKLARHHQARSRSRSVRPPLPGPSSAAMDSSDQKLIGIAVVGEGRRWCVECRTTTTPMWRSGPTGPRSLCNACGIRYRKKRRQELGLDNKQQQQQVDLSEATSAVKDSSSSSSSNGGNKSSSLQVVKKRRVLMGVEEAAFLLMALSSSSTPTLLHG